MSEANEEPASTLGTGKHLNIDFYIIRKGAAVLRALNNALRQQIIQVINESEKITVTELYIKLRIEQSETSQHLAILRQAGIVKTQRVGKFIYYSLKMSRIERIQTLARELVE